MSGEGRRNFVLVMSEFEDPAKSKRVFKKAEALYLMRSFKITTMAADEAIQSYDRLDSKYESGELKVNQHDWHKNERKVFLWYLICYCEERRVSIQEVEDKEWEVMGRIFWGKNPLFLQFQGLNILKTTSRHIWTQQDDELLHKYVTKNGQNEWNAISKEIFFEKERGRFISPKQCRERWYNHICTTVNKSKWGREEDLRIMQLSIEVGKKWSEIARTLGTNRTEHMVKNRYNSIINKVRRRRVENEESLARKALEKLEKEQNSDNSITFEQKQKSKNHTKKQAKQQNDSDVCKKQTQSKVEELMVSQGADSQLRDLNNFINKREKGVIKFVTEQSVNMHLSLNESTDNMPFSLTPSSIRAISPGFGASYISFMKEANANQKRREDGSTMFSPACFSPMPNFMSSFSPGLDFMRLERSGLNTSRELYQSRDEAFISRYVEAPLTPSELSMQYRSIINSKKQPHNQ